MAQRQPALGRTAAPPHGGRPCGRPRRRADAEQRVNDPRGRQGRAPGVRALLSPRSNPPASIPTAGLTTGRRAWSGAPQETIPAPSPCRIAADRASHQHAVSRRAGQGKRAAADYDGRRADAGESGRRAQCRRHRDHAGADRRADQRRALPAVSTTLRRSIQRHPLDGPLVSQLVRPLMRAAYGWQVREPVAPEFGCSSRFVSALPRTGRLGQRSGAGRHRPLGHRRGVRPRLPLLPGRLEPASARPAASARSENCSNRSCVATFDCLERHAPYWLDRMALSRCRWSSAPPPARRRATGG